MLARMNEDIPELVSPDQMPPIISQATLERAWRTLMGELGFADPQLWVLLIREDGRIEMVMPIHEMPATFEERDGESLRGLLEQVPVDSFALLYARPGGRARTPGDMSYARGLSRVARDLGSPWHVHLANDYELTVVAPDDLATAS